MVLIGSQISGHPVSIITGELKDVMVRCETIDNTGPILNHMILPYTSIAHNIASFLFDYDTQQFQNGLTIKKQPLVFRGVDETVESSNDPVWESNNAFSVSNGQFFTVDGANYGWDAATVSMYVVTHIMKVKILTYPESGQKEVLYSFLTDKALPISLTYDKRFVVGSDNDVFTTKPFNIPLNQPIYIRMVYTRMRYTVRYFDCSVQIEVLGIGEAGGDLRCKSKEKKSLTLL